MSQAPPASALARGWRLGRAAVDAGTHEVLARLRPGPQRDAPGAPSARILAGALLELRGAALKVAQFFSLEDDLLPPGVAAELARACHRVPPMGPVFARQVLQRELGGIAQRFAQFDDRPFAAASLGQVHAATALDGRALAVKIQYPAMPDTIRSDLALLRRAASLLPDAAEYRRLLTELQSRLLEECDYRHEAQALDWFAQRLRVPGLTVARVAPELSSGLVLTTGRLPGLHLDDWLATAPTQDERDGAAQRLYDAFVQSLHVLGRLHADPNPGNLLFDGGGRVGLIDFGCTRRIPADYQHIVAGIWRAAVRSDDAAAHAVYREMGLFNGLDAASAWALDQQVMKPFRQWLAMPLQVPRFDFGADRGFVRDGRERFMRCLRERALAGIRPEFVLVNRTLYGLYRIFERMGARVRCPTPWTDGQGQPDATPA